MPDLVSDLLTSRVANESDRKRPIAQLILDVAVGLGFKVGSMFYNGTTDILLGEHENGSPLGLALRAFWDSVLEYLGDQYDDDMSRATPSQLQATAMVMLLSL